MITKNKTEVFTCADGTEHKSIGDAQLHELECIANEDEDAGQDPKAIAEWVFRNAVRIVAILTSTGRKPREKKGAVLAQVRKAAKAKKPDAAKEVS